MLLGIKRAQELNVPITVHAGEWPEKFDTINNLKFAIYEIKGSEILKFIFIQTFSEQL